MRICVSKWPMAKKDNTVLSSWKEIAAYFGKGVRTVQRWERELELPVRRPGGQQHIVMALPSELDSWMRRRLPNGERVPPEAARLRIHELHAQAARLVETTRRVEAITRQLMAAAQQRNNKRSGGVS